MTVFFSSAAFSEAKLDALDRIAAAHGARREGEPVLAFDEVGTEYLAARAAAFGLRDAFRGLRGSDVLVCEEDGAP